MILKYRNDNKGINKEHKLSYTNKYKSEMNGTDIVDENMKYPYSQNSKIYMNEVSKYNSHNKPTIYSSPEEEWTQRFTKIYKKCSKCSKDKLLCNFDMNCSGNCHFNKEGYRHQRPECKMCNKREKETCDIAKKKSKEAGKPTRAPPGTACEICHSIKNLVYDHDHKKLEFRGWLCDPCNRGLGLCGDDIDGLITCLNYLISKRTDKPSITQDSETGLLNVS